MIPHALTGKPVVIKCRPDHHLAVTPSAVPLIYNERKIITSIIILGRDEGMKQENCRNEIAFECDSCGNITMNHIVHQLFHNGDWVGDFCSSGCRDQFLLKKLLEEETIIAVTADNKPIMPDGEIIPLWELLGKPAI